jgi:hypothetical protein
VSVTFWLWVVAAYLCVVLVALWATGVLPGPAPLDLGWPE